MAQCVVCSTEIRDDARFCPSCGAEQPRTEVAGTDGDPLMGRVVAGKFKVEKLLGVGGMGKVYKARQLSLDKAVVVKVLHDHFRDDPQLVQRFQREAKAASRLNHPNSIQIIDFGQDEGGVVFMAMEFLQGQDLFSLLKKEGPLAPERIARVMIQVCSALAEAHEQNVIHRDLKPENIMVEDRRGQKDFVKVLDFGIAKIQDPGEGQQALTQAGMVCGTPEYMSPEQARGLQLDPRSDIYALGVVMYQLAIAELPFTADTPIGIVTKHIIEKPVPPRQRAPHLNVPVELEGILMKALEKEADKRFATVSEMAEALEEFLRARGAAPSSGSGFSQRPLLDTPPSKAGAPSAQPTRTAPTPQGTAPQTTAPELALAAKDAVEAAPRKNNGIKMAAISFVVVAALSFVVVAALGGVGAVVAKNVLKPADKVADAGVTAVVDAGSKHSVVDAGMKLVVADAGVTLVATDAGVGPVDAGASDAAVDPVVDAGARVATQKPDAGPKGHVDRPPSGGGNRAKAVAAWKAAHALFVAGDCAGAMGGLIDAGKLDKTFADPLKDIAMCAKQAGNAQGACSAAKEFADRKPLSGSPRENWLKVMCPGG